MQRKLLLPIKDTEVDLIILNPDTPGEMLLLIPKFTILWSKMRKKRKLEEELKDLEIKTILEASTQQPLNLKLSSIKQSSRTDP